MNEDDHENTPTTVREIGIHIGYLREDVKELKDVANQLAEGTITRKEFEGLTVRVSALEKFLDSIKIKIAGWSIAIFISMVLALYGLDRFFRG